MNFYLLEHWLCRDGGLDARKHITLDVAPKVGQRLEIDGERFTVEYIEGENLGKWKGCTDSSRYDVILDYHERPGAWETAFIKEQRDKYQHFRGKPMSDDANLNCHAGKDGDCIWGGCPQERDNEPHATGRHCPLDYDTEMYIH